MKLIELKCPGCGAQMLVDQVQKKAFCEYCSMVMAVDDKMFDDTPEEAPIDSEEAGYRDEREKENRAEREERYKIAREAKETEMRFSEYQERLQAGEQLDWTESDMTKAPNEISTIVGYTIAALAIIAFALIIIAIGVMDVIDLFNGSFLSIGYFAR